MDHAAWSIYDLYNISYIQMQKNGCMPQNIFKSAQSDQKLNFFSIKIKKIEKIEKISKFQKSGCTPQNIFFYFSLTVVP